jgi:hypothetical protein
MTLNHEREEGGKNGKENIGKFPNSLYQSWLKRIGPAKGG